MVLTKDQLLTRKTKIKEVELPDGGTVCLKPLSAAFFVDGAKKTKDEKEGDEENFAAVLIAECVCDAKGAPLFDRAKDLEAILSLPNAEVVFLFNQIREMNGLIDKAEAEKN